MKVLVSFNQGKNSENFEGVRLRKCIKGALEVANQPYTSYIQDRFDVAHFISPKDEGKIDSIIAEGKPIVISALYCESDPNAAWLEYKTNRKGNRTTSLSQKGLRVLNKATLVLVPTEQAKQFLIDSGVNSEIEILSSGVNMSRFDFSREDEKDIFYRYTHEDKSKKLVIALGDYTHMEGLNAFINAAKKCPNEIFYYYGPSTKGCSFKIKRIIKKAPKNTKFTVVPSDDIYRSGLLNATIFVYPEYKTIGYVSLLEAMAARCQIIIRNQPLFQDLIKNGVNGYTVSYSETLTSVIVDCIDGKTSNIAEFAHKDAMINTLEVVGSKLKWLYQQAINMKNGD